MPGSLIIAEEDTNLTQILVHVYLGLAEQD